MNRNFIGASVEAQIGRALRRSLNMERLKVLAVLVFGVAVIVVMYLATRHDS